MAHQSSKLIFLVYCNSTSSFNNLNCFVSCSTLAGAIPLGAVMTSSKDTKTLVSEFMILSNNLPNCASLAEVKQFDLRLFLQTTVPAREALQLT